MPTRQQIEFIKKHGVTKCPPGRAFGSESWAMPGSEQAAINYLASCRLDTHLSEKMTGIAKSERKNRRLEFLFPDKKAGRKPADAA